MRRPPTAVPTLGSIFGFIQPGAAQPPSYQPQERPPLPTPPLLPMRGATDLAAMPAEAARPTPPPAVTPSVTVPAVAPMAFEPARAEPQPTVEARPVAPLPDPAQPIAPVSFAPAGIERPTPEPVVAPQPVAERPSPLQELARRIAQAETFPLAEPHEPAAAPEIATRSSAFTPSAPVASPPEALPAHWTPPSLDFGLGSDVPALRPFGDRAAEHPEPGADAYLPVASPVPEPVAVGGAWAGEPEAAHDTFAGTHSVAEPEQDEVAPQTWPEQPFEAAASEHPAVEDAQHLDVPHAAPAHDHGSHADAEAPSPAGDTDAYGHWAAEPEPYRPPFAEPHDPVADAAESAWHDAAPEWHAREQEPRSEPEAPAPETVEPEWPSATSHWQEPAETAHDAAAEPDWWHAGPDQGEAEAPEADQPNAWSYDAPPAWQASDTSVADEDASPAAPLHYGAVPAAWSHEAADRVSFDPVEPNDAPASDLDDERSDWTPGQWDEYDAAALVPVPAVVPQPQPPAPPTAADHDGPVESGMTVRFVAPAEPVSTLSLDTGFDRTAPITLAPLTDGPARDAALPQPAVPPRIAADGHSADGEHTAGEPFAAVANGYAAEAPAALPPPLTPPLDRFDRHQDAEPPQSWQEPEETVPPGYQLLARTPIPPGVKLPKPKPVAPKPPAAPLQVAQPAAAPRDAAPSPRPVAPKPPAPPAPRPQTIQPAAAQPTAPKLVTPKLPGQNTGMRKVVPPLALALVLLGTGIGYTWFSYAPPALRGVVSAPLVTLYSAQDGQVTGVNAEAGLHLTAGREILTIRGVHPDETVRNDIQARLQAVQDRANRLQGRVSDLEAFAAQIRSGKQDSVTARSLTEINSRLADMRKQQEQVAGDLNTYRNALVDEDARLAGTAPQNVAADRDAVLWSLLARDGAEVKRGTPVAQIADCSQLYIQSGNVALSPGSTVKLQLNGRAGMVVGRVRQQNGLPEGTKQIIDVDATALQHAAGDPCPIGRAVTVIPVQSRPSTIASLIR